MKNQLDGLDTGDAVIDDKDVIQGNNYGTLESGVYPFFLEEAFLEPSDSGALGVHLTFKEKADGTGKVLEKTIYIKSGDAKGNKSYYVDSNGKQQPLPGYTIIDSLCRILLGKPLKDMSTTDMAAEVYDKEEKKRITQTVQMIKPLLNKPVYVAVIKQIVDKTARNDAGAYVTVPGTREENEIVKFFQARDKKTVTEMEAKTDEPAAFFHTWAKEWTGKTRDRTKAKKGAAPAPAGANSENGVSNMFTG